MKESNKVLIALERLANDYGDVSFSEVTWGVFPSTGALLEFKVGLSPSADFDGEDLDEAYSFLSLKVFETPGLMKLQAMVSLCWFAPGGAVAEPVVYPLSDNNRQVEPLQQWLREHSAAFKIEDAHISTIVPALQSCVAVLATVDDPKWLAEPVSAV